MDLNQSLERMKEGSPIAPREEALLRAMERGKDVYFQQIPLSSSWDFLRSQFCLMRKRWWLFQAALLALAMLVIPRIHGYFPQIRSISIIGCLFAIFLIPELWRNKNCDAIQVESACFYSLRYIYAARFTLFGIVDLFLLTLFCFGLHNRLGMDFPELVRQLLLPVTVTAGICFQTLGGRRDHDGSLCLIFCLCWCAGWWLVATNQALYPRIAPGLWMAFFFLALAFLVTAAVRALRTTNQYWEVSFS